MSKILKTYKKLKDKPFGKWLFIKAVGWQAPYLNTIKASVIDLKPGFGSFSMKNRRSVQNHLKAVHAIAICNLCELTAALTTDATIPAHKRWIPTEMNIRYLAKGKTKLTATCYIDHQDWDGKFDLPVRVRVEDANGVKVSVAVITMKISDR
ncbi:MAG: DUF4442 domain-containing protein [Bacteroidetes bacterium]|nr:DUF4442 domain-containing protein [Bacteroidota bacterium]